MKIFEIKFIPEAETYWILAKNKKDAEQIYEQEVGNDDINTSIMKEIPQNKWGELYIFDPNDYHPDPPEDKIDDYHNGFKIIMSFEQYAEGETGGSIISSTEY